MKATLIIAVDPQPRVEDVTVCLILCRHRDGIDVCRAVGAAFTEWAKTEEGAEFVRTNGNNWGDSLDIPDRILRKHGMYKYEGLLCGREVVGAKYDHEIMVEHGENLAEG